MNHLKKSKNYIFKKNHKELSDSINGFVAYCDVNAKSTNDDGKSYYPEKEGKRCIAKAFIRQNAWVMNIIQYLINLKEKEEKDMYENVAYGVKRALMYFKKPNEQFNILSERHIKSISEYYGVEMYNSKNEFCFDEELRMLFEESIKEELEKENISEENYTSIYSNIIYEHRNEWEIMVDTSLLEANKNVILTGVSFEENKIGAACIGEDRKPQYYFNEKIPENYHGTGDVFASAFSGALLNGFSLYDSMCIAVRFTCDCIKRTKESSPDTHYGVDFERGIPYLLKELKKI